MIITITITITVPITITTTITTAIAITITLQDNCHNSNTMNDENIAPLMPMTTLSGTQPYVYVHVYTCVNGCVRTYANVNMSAMIDMNMHMDTNMEPNNVPSPCPSPCPEYLSQPWSHDADPPRRTGTKAWHLRDILWRASEECQ